ncbi:MAG: hypothetical protein HKO59_12840 [Phycisphaerales bacterium]|nr:hypothetical protein [Phycisphaerae bacterium]NNF43197.1 hypothetical protein [Phycisphaerales bacterium]NNM26850.1 hypothetical protein [Phycisphaerales bacterium]
MVAAMIVRVAEIACLVSILALGASGPIPTAVMTQTPPPAGVGTPERWSDLFERPARGPARPLSDETIALALIVADDVDPQLATRLRRLQARDPVQFERKLRQTHRLIDLAQLKQHEPDLYDRKLIELRVDAEVNRLVGILHEARRSGRTQEAAATEQSLRMQVILQLAFAYQAREDYLCRLQDLVEKLEGELARERTYFNDHLDEVVDARIEEMLKQRGE